jgi:hypothetical protein
VQIVERLTDRYGIVILVTVVLLLLSIAAGVAAASVMSPTPTGTDLRSAILGQPIASRWMTAEDEFPLGRV